MKNKNKILKNIFYIFVVLVLITPSFVFKKFGKLDLEQIIFLFVSEGAGADLSIIYEYAAYAAYTLLWLGLALFVIFKITKRYHKKFKEHKHVVRIRNNKYVIKMKAFLRSPKFLRRTFSQVTIVMVVLALFLNHQFDVSGFIASSKDVTHIYEMNYVNPKDATIKFPKKKRNLIHIYVESMNTNFSSMELEEGVVNLIPNLQSLAEENVSFSNTDEFGGFKQLRGISWTVASLTAQTSGVPLNVPLKRNKYGTNGHFLPGINTLGEILKSNGYSNYFVMGSDGNFGGRQTYFETHGEYDIIDTKYLKEIGYIPEDYDVFWGMEDLKLFDVAKTSLLDVAAKDEPFNFSVLTVDSHYPKGYVDETCELPYENEYANAISCSDEKVIEFVRWIQAQDFYENTTIILSGDHNTMNDEFLKQSTIDTNTIFNTFINLPFDESNLRTEFREFSAMDMFPTTLSALGAEIEGNRLGLGVNMFSDKYTLIEQMSVQEINKEFGKNSKYYHDNFFTINGIDVEDIEKQNAE